MAISYEIDEGASIIRISVADPLDVSEIVEIVNDILAAPTLRPGLAVLSNHSQLKGIATSELVKSVVPLLKRLGERLGPFRCAVVAPKDASYGMARMAEVFAEDTPARVRAFRTSVEAQAWLAREDPTA